MTAFAIWDREEALTQLSSPDFTSTLLADMQASAAKEIEKHREAGHEITWFERGRSRSLTNMKRRRRSLMKRAFPRSIAIASTDSVSSIADGSEQDGMSLRSYFAAHSPFDLNHAILAAGYAGAVYSEIDKLAELLQNDEKRGMLVAIFAMLAFEYADEMMRRCGE